MGFTAEAQRTRRRAQNYAATLKADAMARHDRTAADLSIELKNPRDAAIPLVVFMIAAPIGLIIAVVLKNPWHVNYPAGLITGAIVIAVCAFALACGSIVTVRDIFLMRVVVTSSHIEVLRPWSPRRVSISDIVQVRYGWAPQRGILRQRRHWAAQGFIVQATGTDMFLSPRMRNAATGMTMSQALLEVIPEAKCESILEYEKRISAAKLW